MINLNDIEWSEQIVNYSLSHTLKDIDENISENEKEDEFKKVARIIKEYNGGSGISSHELSNRTRFLDRRRRVDIINDMIEGETISIYEQSTGGRKLRIYKINGERE